MGSRELSIESLLLTKEIAHTIIHRMSLWQFITIGKFWRKQYDETCEKLSLLGGEEPKQTISNNSGTVPNET